MAAWMGRGPTPRPEQLEEEAMRERDLELDRIAERERAAEEAVPPRHRVRLFFARFRRKH
jgi:hypothetical protein